MKSSTSPAVVGLGIDTARYTHVASFWGHDKIGKPIPFDESAAGYETLRQKIEKVREKYPTAELKVRVDAAGQYADNLLAWLHSNGFEVSVGEPKRNKDYRAAINPKTKSDRAESLALARYAVKELPAPRKPLSEAMKSLQELARAAECETKQLTRSVNQLHAVLARAFPELATVVNDISATSILDLLSKYPTASRVAKARLSSIKKTRYLKKELARDIHAAAKTSIGSAQDKSMEDIVKMKVEKVQEVNKRLEKLKKSVEANYDALPHNSGIHQLKTLPGFGTYTAAVFAAKVGDIAWFENAKKLVGYFGVFPEEDSSGFEKDGTPKPSRKTQMSKKGCDLIRKLLWLAAMNAKENCPRMNAFYEKKKEQCGRGDVAFGHCMKKLIVWAHSMWVNNTSYNPTQEEDRLKTMQQEIKEAAGHSVKSSSDRIKVTAALNNVSTEEADVKPSPGSKVRIDFAHVREQISMESILRHIGCFEQLRGSGEERRGPCPIHKSKSLKSRNFAVNLRKNIFKCHASHCDAGGNAMDLWAAIQGISIYEAAMHLGETFDFDPTGTESRSTSNAVSLETPSPRRRPK